jgi:hypothetical protein
VADKPNEQGVGPAGHHHPQMLILASGFDSNEIRSKFKKFQLKLLEFIQKKENSSKNSARLFACQRPPKFCAD